MGIDLTILNDTELQELGFKLYREGETLTAIGELLGRSIGRISRWKSNGKWEDRDLAIQMGEDDPGTAVGLIPVREEVMLPEEMANATALIISRVLQRANEALENHALDFKNVYHYKAIFEMLEALQRAARLANDMAGEIKEVRHVHILDADLASQIRWLQSMVNDGVDPDTIIIPQEIGGDDA